MLCCRGTRAVKKADLSDPWVLKAINTATFVLAGELPRPTFQAIYLVLLAPSALVRGDAVLLDM